MTDPELALGCQPREAEWRGCWEKLCLRAEKGWALEVWPSDTGHMNQGAGEATRGTARGHSAQSWELQERSIAGGKTNKD